MVRPGARKRGVLALVQGRFASERRACDLLKVSRSAHRRPCLRAALPEPAAV